MASVQGKRLRYHDERARESMKSEMRNREIRRHMLMKELVTLKGMLPGPLDAKFAGIFEEYIGHHEFGLALDIICDHLLEPITPPVSASVLEQIQKLRGLMEWKTIVLRNCSRKPRAVSETEERFIARKGRDAMGRRSSLREPLLRRGEPAHVPEDIFGCGEQKGVRRRKPGRLPSAGRLRSE
jgi:hypothetical protein